MVRVPQTHIHIKFLQNLRHKSNYARIHIFWLYSYFIYTRSLYILFCTSVSCASVCLVSRSWLNIRYSYYGYKDNLNRVYFLFQQATCASSFSCFFFLLYFSIYSWIPHTYIHIQTLSYTFLLNYFFFPKYTSFARRDQFLFFCVNSFRLLHKSHLRFNFLWCRMLRLHIRLLSSVYCKAIKSLCLKIKKNGTIDFLC